MNKAQYETAKANAYLEAVADANMAGKSFAEASKAGAEAVRDFEQTVRADADNAEYEFNLYCAEGAGVKASEILDSMAGFDFRDQAFWKLAFNYAVADRAEWLAR